MTCEPFFGQYEDNQEMPQSTFRPNRVPDKQQGHTGISSGVSPQGMIK